MSGNDRSAGRKYCAPRHGKKTSKSTEPTPSPLVGEGRGEGEIISYAHGPTSPLGLCHTSTLRLGPLHQRRHLPLGNNMPMSCRLGQPHQAGIFILRHANSLEIKLGKIVHRVHVDC